MRLPSPSDLGAHLPALLLLAAPIAMAQLAQMSMALTDTILLGSLGDAALAAGGLAAGSFFTLVVILQGVPGAAAIGIAQALGARENRPLGARENRPLGARENRPPGSSREAGAGRIAASALLLGLLLSVPAFLAVSHVDWLMRRLGEPPVLARDVGAYMDVLRWGTPAALAGVGVMRAVLPAIGGAGLLLRIMPCVAILNGLLNYGLIHGTSVLGFWSLPRMGLLGSALATTLTLWITPCVLAAATLSRPRLRALLHPFVPDRAAVAMLLRLGLPVSATYAAEVLLFQVVGLQAGLLGAASLAAHQIALNVASCTFMLPLALSQAACVRMGFWTGAGQPLEARRSGAAAIGLTLLMMSGLGLLLLAFAPLVVGAYLDTRHGANRDAAGMAEGLLGIAALFQIADGVQSVALGALRGRGDTAVPMLIATVGYWGIGFPLGTAAAFHFGFGVLGLWVGIACALASVAVMTSLRLLRRAPGSLRPIEGIA